MKNWIFEVESCLIPLFELSEEYESYAASRGADARELPGTLMLYSLIRRLRSYCLRMAEADCAAEGAADERTFARMQRIERLSKALEDSPFCAYMEGSAEPELTEAQRAELSEDEDQKTD